MTADRPQPAAQAAPARPVLRVVRGDATPAEIAALVAVLTAQAVNARSADEAARRTAGARRSAWADPAAAVRRGTSPGRGAWERSGREPGARTRAGW